MKNQVKIFKEQFYHRNKFCFLIAVLSCLLIASLNLAIAWVLQQIIDAVSGVSGALSLSTLALSIAGIILLIIVFKGFQYISKPKFMQKAMQQYKDYAFQKLTQKSIAAFSTENTADYLSAFSNDLASIEKGYLETQFSILSNAVIFIGALIMMLCYSPIMTVISCAFFILPIGASF